MHVFGGSKNKRQISRLNGLKLEYIGSLSFDHQFGGCVAVKDEIYICFGTAPYSECRRAIGPLDAFTEISNSIYSHRDAKISASNGK